MMTECESKPWARMFLGAVALIVAGIATPTAAQEPDDFDCLIEPHAVTDVSTREEGVLEEILVDRGDLVEAGQVIARLESEIEEAAVELIRVRTQRDAEVEERELEIAFTKRQLKRAENL